MGLLLDGFVCEKLNITIIFFNMGLLLDGFVCEKLNMGLPLKNTICPN